MAKRAAVPVLEREIRIIVPLTPPSVNNYVRHTRSGGHYVTPAATNFKEVVALYGRSYKLRAKSYEIEVWVYFGKGQRGDGDNLWKCIADALVDGGIIHSDAAVDNWILFKRRDPADPRTEIIVRTLA